LKEYYNSLTPQTADVLTFMSGISELKDFTLVGGSALSIHLQHRLSEDLDFFTWFETLNMVGMDSIVRQISKGHSVKILNTYSDGIDISLNGVKVTFFASSWDKLKNRELLYKNCSVGKLELLTAMKVNTLSLRAKFRDYYDLYVITKEVFDIKKIFDTALEYIPGMTKKIFSMQLVYVEDVDDETIEHLNPKYEISLDEIRIFFEEEIKKIL
jgi:predicted nucleotidyltransferase component of viral defense system